MWKIKKKGFFAKIAWHYLCQEGRKNAHFRAHYLFWPKFFWPKQIEPRNTIQIGVSAEIAQNQKWHLFLEEVFFDMVEELGFTNCVFEKLCFFVFGFFLCFFGGFKGQVRWPKGPPHLALNPPYFLFWGFCFFVFAFFFCS